MVAFILLSLASICASASALPMLSHHRCCPQPAAPCDCTNVSCFTPGPAVVATVPSLEPSSDCLLPYLDAAITVSAHGPGVLAARAAIPCIGQQADLFPLRV